MKLNRGDVVLVDFPFSAGGGAKVRPALLIHNDRDKRRLVNTIVAQITSTTHRALQPAQMLILLIAPEGQQGELQGYQGDQLNDHLAPPAQWPPNPRKTQLLAAYKLI